MFTITRVSYTHLDVYKRQTWKSLISGSAPSLITAATFLWKSAISPDTCGSSSFTIVSSRLRCVEETGLTLHRPLISGCTWNRFWGFLRPLRQVHSHHTTPALLQNCACMSVSYTHLDVYKRQLMICLVVISYGN